MKSDWESKVYFFHEKPLVKNRRTFAVQVFYVSPLQFYVEVGIARCSDGDNFDKFIGREYARHRLGSYSLNEYRYEYMEGLKWGMAYAFYPVKTLINDLESKFGFRGKEPKPFKFKVGDLVEVVGKLAGPAAPIGFTGKVVRKTHITYSVEFDKAFEGAWDVFGDVKSGLGYSLYPDDLKLIYRGSK